MKAAHDLAWRQDDANAVGALRPAASSVPMAGFVPTERRAGDDRLPDRTVEGSTWRPLATWSLPSEPGNERRAMEQVAAAIGELGVLPRRLERLKMAVAEATMNAIEHGNQDQPDVPVCIEVLVSPAALAVRITDEGGSEMIGAPAIPDLTAKLAGLQSPRGWGLFLMTQLVDEIHMTADGARRTVELILYLNEKPA